VLLDICPVRAITFSISAPGTKQSVRRKAIRYHAFGGPDALKVEDITVPHPGPGEIRITVHCAGVNPSDWKRREGQYQAFEDISFPLTVGVEASGIRAHYLQ